MLLQKQAAHTEQQSNYERDLIKSIRVFYERGAQGDLSSSVRHISEQAVRVMDQLLVPRSNTFSGTTSKSTVASVFREIVGKFQTSSETPEMLSQTPSLIFPDGQAAFSMEDIIATFSNPGTLPLS